MKVALVSKSDAQGGGASRVADDLHVGFQGRPGITTRRYVGHVPAEGSSADYEPIVSRALRAYQRLRSAAERRGYIDHFPLELIGLNPGIRKADVIHCHDLSTAFAPSGLLLLSYFKSIAWTLHDLSPITGGCIYPLGCGRYREACGCCPLLGEWPLPGHADRTSEMARWRRKVLASGRLKLIAPSQWMRQQVLQGHPDANIDVIYNGVDIRTFHPRPKRAFSPRDDRLKVLFVANYFHEVRKGGLYIPEIVAWLNQTNREMRLVVAGNTGDQGVVEMGPLEMVLVGHVGSKADLVELYGTVDAMLVLSHADNCPLVVLEALACGVPSFAFATGGIPELISAECGGVRDPGDIGRLLGHLFEIAEGGRLPELGAAARDRAERLFSVEHCLDRHADLYRRLAERHAKTAKNGHEQDL